MCEEDLVENIECRGGSKDMINELNERFSIVQKEDIKSGVKGISKMLAISPIKLPDDYISFLKHISGEGCFGVWLEADGRYPLWLFSATEAISKMEDYKSFLDNIWLIGNDLGDAVYFYQKSETGIGIYYESDIGAMGAPDNPKPQKVADTLTDFLVNGIGIDVMKGDV